MAAPLSLTPSWAQTSKAADREQLLAIQQRIESGDFDGARSLLKDAQRQHPADAGLENLLGVVEAQQGHNAAALAAFREAVQHNPRLLSALMNLSRIEMQTAQTDRNARADAKRHSEQILTLDPSNDEARYQLASVLLWNGEARQALAQLARLSEKSRSEPQVQSLVCEGESLVGSRADMNRAVTALTSNPSESEVDANACLAGLRKAHRADLIDRLYTSAAAHAPLSPQAQRVLGLAQEAEGKLTAARSTLEAAFTAFEGKNPALLVDLTRVAEALGDHKAALGYLAHARDLSPTDPELPYEFGAISLRLGLYGEARKALEESLRLAPDDPSSNFALGLVISYSADPTQGLPYLKKYHEMRPNDPEGLLALGTANYRAKDYETATKWLNQAVASPKTAADAHLYLGRIARQQGQFEKAVAELNQSLALHPAQADPLSELGQIALLQRDYKHAADRFQAALRLDPENYTANFGLLRLYAQTGDPRREEQSKRFDALKDKKEEQDRQMMRVIEIRRNDHTDPPGRGKSDSPITNPTQTHGEP